MKRVLIATPCYNETANIRLFHDLVSIETDEIKGYEFSFLYVNDGSKDTSLNIIEELSQRFRNVHYINFSRNFGKEAAMKAAFDYAHQKDYDAMILMDTDLQDDPKIIKEMITKWEEGYEHIYTKHKTRKGQTLIKKVGSNMFYKIYARLTGNKNIENGARDFALYNKGVIKAFKEYPNIDRFTKGIAEFVGFKKYCIEFDYIERVGGKTKWNYKKLAKYALTGFSSFSEWLRIIPKFFSFFCAMFFGYDLVYAVFKETKIDTSANEHILNVLNNTNLRISLVALLICILTATIIELNYQTKRIAENKPLYIVEATDNND